ncbi:hypothetical protein JB92DRAFT_856569 [Gautieria morchelliformis]|nr:hypothetical protein JB92DRAFT_856569 [Gautieria morchelliformis]
MHPTPPPTSRSSGSRSISDPQFDTARRLSSSRLLSVWSTLEDKYRRRIDEDDIVDLRSGGFYKDRGVLNDKAGKWEIGCFSDPKEAQNLGPDDDEDEIGGWASDSEFDHQFINPIALAPVCELDPEDAADLRAFLAAEHARKDSHGTDDDFISDEVEPNDNGLQLDADAEDSVLEVEAGSARLSPTESDDDLAGYDDTVGEGALLWEVSSELSNCSEPLQKVA